MKKGRNEIGIHTHGLNIAITVILVATMLFWSINSFDVGSFLHSNSQFDTHESSLIGLNGNPAPSTENWKSSSSFLKYAFFPKEPRLQDVQPISGFAPIGIASYGSNGTITQTSGVQGVAAINFAGIGFFSGTLINNSAVLQYFGVGNASLQENSVAFLGSTLGYFWAQNVVLMSQVGSSAMYELQLINNIWDFNSVNANMNSAMVSGNGSVQCESVDNVSSCAYITVDPAFFSVTAPFKVKLTMLIGEGNPGGATDISFDYQVSDSSGQNLTGSYDDAILFPGKSSVPAQFQIGGETPLTEALPGGTSITLPSDLEFVLGGPGGGSNVFLNTISASEQLFYSSGSSFVPVIDAFSVGSDTGEMASGVSVSPDLRNQSFPFVFLRSGFISAYKLWPVPLGMTLSAVENLGSGYLQLEGKAFYTGGNSSAAGLNITEKTVPTNPSINMLFSTTHLTTDGNGAFSFVFKPPAQGTFALTFSYSGSVAFLLANITEKIAVSAIDLASLPLGSSVIVNVNSTQSFSFLSTSENRNLLISLVNGTSLSISFDSVSLAGNNLTREVFSGFFEGGLPTLQALSSPISFSGGANGSILALFKTQYNVTISNPYAGSYSSKWYNQSAAIQLSSPPIVSKSGQDYAFSGWIVNGRELNSSLSNITLVADSPLVITAQYAMQGNNPLVSIIVLLIVASAISLVVGLAVGLYLGRRPMPLANLPTSGQNQLATPSNSSSIWVQLS